MAVKVCCVDACSSSSIREEDIGVTYHKFPKDVALRTKWIEVTQHDCNTEVLEYVCSRHFCKSDFRTYKDSKYILKSAMDSEEETLVVPKRTVCRRLPSYDESEVDSEDSTPIVPRKNLLRPLPSYESDVDSEDETLSLPRRVVKMRLPSLDEVLEKDSKDEALSLPKRIVRRRLPSHDESEMDPEDDTLVVPSRVVRRRLPSCEEPDPVGSASCRIDAVPSIFPWTKAGASPKDKTTKMDIETSPEKTPLETEKSKEVLNTSEESENVESIKAFIEKQEIEAIDAKSDVTYCDEVEKIEIKESVSQEVDDRIIDVGNADDPIIDIGDSDEEVKHEHETSEEKLEMASSVMDIILSQSVAKIDMKKNDAAAERKRKIEVYTGSTPLRVGSKVEAKDFREYWHPAEVMEVDLYDNEVLVHYENETKKLDEWISVSSPRLRPRGSGPRVPTQPSTPTATTPDRESSAPVPPTSIKATTQSLIKEEIKDKNKLVFEVGERCLARWRDNRRFIATINVDFGDGKYEIIFDDGVKWTCTVNRLSKLKNASKNDPLTVDTSGNMSTCSTPSPVLGAGPSDSAGLTSTTPQLAHLPFNTHLFDPTRDYLGSKSERREKKRKLNIKEIFNIGQKKKKVEPTRKKPPPKLVAAKEKPKPVKKNIKEEPIERKVKKEIPDAVASIIGTQPKEPPNEIPKVILTKIKEEVAIKEEIKEEIKSDPVEEATNTLDESQLIQIDDIKIDEDETKMEIEVTTLDIDDSKLDMDDCLDLANSETLSAPESQEMKHEDDSALDEDVKLEKFVQKDDIKHEQVLDRIKEVIGKLEDGINQSEHKIEQLNPKLEIKDEGETKPKENEDSKVVSETKEKKSLSKIRKVKKVRLLQERRVKKQVEKVQSELEEVRRQMEEMKRKMAEELSKQRPTEMPESFLLPGEWCCKWVNGQPVGKVSEVEHETKLDANNKPVLPRRSVEVVDKRLPPGWTKHMVRRSLGHSAGKWDVVLMSPDNRRFHTKTDMKHFLESSTDEGLKTYTDALMDFGIHLKLSRRMGWYTTTDDGEQEAPLPVGPSSNTSPLVRKKHLSLKKAKLRELKLEKKKNKMKLKFKMPKIYPNIVADGPIPGAEPGASEVPMAENLPLEDGYVYVGSLKVQIIENLLRCPAEGCFKNFRNNTLLKMHIKHYHRELTKQLGATPKVLDLAYARAKPTEMEMKRLKLEARKNSFRVKLRKLPKKLLQQKLAIKDSLVESKLEPGVTPNQLEEKVRRSQDSPQLRQALNKPLKGPKVLLPVRRTDASETVVSGTEIKEEDTDEENLLEPKVEVPLMEALDFETAISTHTVTKPCDGKRKEKRKFAPMSKLSEDEDWFGGNSDMDTRSSNPGSGTPDSKLDQKLVSSESNEDHKDSNYAFIETGERVKIVHMKREEIINCHCGFREEDGLMVQCELCFCWQHALCHNIQKESEVPEKYTCSICLNPRRGRRSQRFLHDQDRLYEGLLPGAKPCESLRRSHELSGNLLRIQDALHALRVKYHVAIKKNHPKLYLWAKDWEAAELTMTQERLNSDYSDLNIMINSLGKENLPIKPEDVKDIAMELRTPPSEEPHSDGYSQKESQLGSQALLSGLLSSPGGASLDLPISATDLEKLANTVQAEQESQRVIIPQPEAAIENSVCRERLLKHIQRCQAVIDARLDSIEAQVAELESQDPSLEDDETADYFPRTKQTIQMMMRDLDSMEELGVIT